MNNKMFVAYAPDNNYTNLTIVSMMSLYENNKDKEIEFIILQSNLTVENKEKFNWFNRFENCKVRIITVNEDEFNGFPISNWVTIQAWFRIMIPTLCPDVDKILYLDCDTLVNSSIGELWNIDLKNNYLAAVKDILYCSEHVKRLKLQSDCYFNSGMLLINCDAFRKNDIVNEIKAVLNSKKYKIKFCDQDTLNIIADIQKLILPMKFNYMENWWHNYYYEYFDSDEVQYLEARKRPIIVHFSGIKPTHKGCKHSQKQNWWKYAELTSIYNEILKEYSLTYDTSTKKNIFKSIFGLKSEYKNNKKWKVLILFGIKIKFNISKNRPHFNIEDLIIKTLSINIKFGRWIVKFFNLKFRHRNNKELSLYIKAKKANIDITKLPTANGIVRDIQLGNLALLKEFDYVCKLNNLNYWLDFGTLLGAVRHKGFIPWDDDIDVGMPRNDYLNIITLFDKSARNPDLYIEVVRNKHVPCMQFLKIMHKKLPFLWIDIFPYDFTHIELNSDNFNNLNNNINNLRIRTNDKKELLKYSLSDLDIYIKKEMNSILDSSLLTQKEEPTGIVRGIDFPHPHNIWIYDYNDIFPLIDVEFEGYRFKTVQNIHKYLSDVFGNSYMGYPQQIELAHTLKLLISKKEEKFLKKLIEQGDR